MSWSLSTSGDEGEIGNAFDTQRKQAAEWGMIEAEQRDIDEARDFAMQFANQYGRVAVSANGHWNNVGSENAGFGRVSVTIDKLSEEASAPSPESPSA